MNIGPRRGACLISLSIFLLMGTMACEDKKKEPPEQPVFIERQPIIRYKALRENELTVQVGRHLHSQYDAFVLAGRLRDAGINCFIERSERHDKYRVCVGTFLTTERAERMKKTLISKNIGNLKIAGPFRN